MSLFLCTICSDHQFRETLDDTKKGIVVNGTPLNNCRNADDSVLPADSPEGLQRLIDRVASVCEICGMKLNIKKTKKMTVSKNRNDVDQFNIEEDIFERAQNFSYVGCIINEDWDHSREFRIPIKKARNVFY